MKKTTLLTTGLLLAFATPVLAERPTAPRLFSGKAIVYARVNDSRELKDKMAETSTGKMTEDKDIKPIIDSFYTSFTQLVQGMQKEVGVNFDELLSIPNGEMAMAVIPTKTNPAICFLIEAGSEMPAVELIIERLDQRDLPTAGCQSVIARERVTKSIGRSKSYDTNQATHRANSDISSTQVFWLQAPLPTTLKHWLKFGKEVVSIILPLPTIETLPIFSADVLGPPANAPKSRFMSTQSRSPENL